MKSSAPLAVAVFAGLCAEFLTTQIAGAVPLFAEQNSQVSLCDNITRGFCAVDFFRVTPGGVIGVIVGYAVCFWMFGMLAPRRTILAYAASSATMWVIASGFGVMDLDFGLAALIVVALLGVSMLILALIGTAVYFSGKFLLKAKGKHDDRRTFLLALPPPARLAVAVFAGLCAEFLTAQITGRMPFLTQLNSQEAVCASEHIIKHGFCNYVGGVVGVIMGYAVCFWTFGMLAPRRTILTYAASSAILWALVEVAVLYWTSFVGISTGAALFGMEILAVSVAGTAVYFSGKYVLNALEKKQ